MRKLKRYKPTKFMAEGSRYDKEAADAAVAFINCLKHTKGEWYGMPFELIDWQEQIVRDIFGVLKPNGYRQFNTAYVEIPKKQGKQLALDTPVPTPNGWKRMGELKQGDLVFDENGNPCHVLALSEIDDAEQAYRLTFGDGSSIIAGARHLWKVQVINNGRKERLLQTQQMYEAFSAYRERHKDDPFRSIYRIPVAGALKLPDAKLPVDPYLYGYWLGNGCATKPEITIRTCDVAGVLKRIPYEVSSLWKNVGDSVVVRIPVLKSVLLKSHHSKHIPLEYLRASENQRWELLQGLMDSDGCIGKIKAQSTYVSTERQLALDVRELLWSLGIKNSMTESPSQRCGKPTGKTLYTIRFTSFADLPTSGLVRKLRRRKETGSSPTRSNYHYIHSIEPVKERIPMRCIQVSSPSRQYLAGPSMVPTHNSELAAAIALYLTCGDFEHGGEVYGCASDRQQASIVFDVAVDMVEQCPALKSRIKPMLSQKRLVYRPLGSFYQVLSAEAYTKHGLNVHGVVFDELHAQPNRDLYDVMLHGSGDARKQPLFFLITTAGTDRNSICWEVHQKAEDILQRRKIDPTFYPVIYSAADTDDWTSEKVWRKVNPSLGITVDIEKLRVAFENAKQNPAEENLFRQLRLNQWVKQSVRWMPMDKWDRCAFPVDADSLHGRTCYGGLDLSSTTDITAFVLVFPPLDEDDKYQILPFFWIPEDNIDQRVRRDHVPYDVWERQGFLYTTEGNVVHYGFIESFIEELGMKYNIKEIAFDRWGAVQMTQNLEALGFTVVPFGQGFKDMSPPTKELMKLTLEERIAHGGHLVLRWMMDNIFVKTDPAGNIKPDKEKSTERIDGAVALIMALDRALRHSGENTGSVYDERGLLFI
ncbi:terminase TerL endonuclease subunit [Acetivibrio clariflavus]|uniref:terminase TerL endonuclease subunit n=1 Tax=Acetivibrio clariflavus TaxID=288965 RepID=UPI0006859726